MKVSCKQLTRWIQQKQPVTIKTTQGETTFLIVKLYEDAKKLFAYDRQAKLTKIALDDIISIQPVRIYGSFYVQNRLVKAIW
ncbi:hypothetical protein [Paranoxybacillus vitaminiphilus]|nr:hypothetical protein [Anoxybacillus vitaminiphilus]